MKRQERLGPGGPDYRDETIVDAYGQKSRPWDGITTWIPYGMQTGHGDDTYTQSSPRRTSLFQVVSTRKHDTQSQPRGCS